MFKFDDTMYGVPSPLPSKSSSSSIPRLIFTRYAFGATRQGRRYRREEHTMYAKRFFKRKFI